MGGLGHARALGSGTLLFLGLGLFHTLERANLGLASGALLAALNYVANTQQTPQVLNSINLTISVIPCAICVVNAILYRFYPISQKKHKEIMDELIRRRTVTN